MMTPNELLKAKRTALKYSQVRMAEEVKLPQGYLSQLESGKSGITAETIRKYRKVVPITDDDALFLLGLKEVL